MICYICKTEVQDLDALVVHYKIIHVLKPNSTYTCCEGLIVHNHLMLCLLLKDM